MQRIRRNVLVRALSQGVAVGLCCAAPLVAGAQVSPEEVESAIHAAWSASTTPPDLKDLTIRWRLELFFVPEQGKLNDLREAVRGHPEHPRAADLAGYEAALRGEPIQMGRHLLMRSAERWRFGRDMTQTEYLDVIVDGGNRWELTPTVLRILPATMEFVALGARPGSVGKFTAALTPVNLWGVTKWGRESVYQGAPLRPPCSASTPAPRSC